MNPEQKKQAIVMGALGVVLLGVVVWQITRKPPEATEAMKIAAAASQTAVAPGGKPAAAALGAPSGKVEFKTVDVNIPELLASVEVLEFDYVKNEITRDPMTPLIQPPPKRGSRRDEPIDQRPVLKNKTDEIYLDAIRQRVVSGILWDKTNPFAVVDNEIVTRGSVLPAGELRIEVLDIGRDFVLFKGGENVVLPVGLKEQ